VQYRIEAFDRRQRMLYHIDRAYFTAPNQSSQNRCR
jgi:hypothetical protein